MDILGRMLKNTRRDSLAVLGAKPQVTHNDEIAKYYALTAQVDARRNPAQAQVVRENDRLWAGRR